MKPRARTAARGFALLSVTLAMALIGAVAFLINRDNGVQARMIRSQADLDRARYLAEAGLQAANYQVQQRGCAGGYPTAASPVVNESFGGGGYSAYADRAAGFPVTLTATGTYNDSSVTLTRSNVLVFQSPARSATLQPDPGAGVDTYLDANKPTFNYGAADSMSLWDGRLEPLLKLDLSALPGGSRVVPWYDGSALQPGAALSLYQINGPASVGAVSAYLMTYAWTEGTLNGTGQQADGATWATYDGTNAWPAAGASYDPRPLATRPYVSASGWTTWDLTDAASAWAGNVYPNHGVRIRVSSGAINSLQYASSDYTANTAYRPKLAVNYLAPCAVNPPPLTLYAAADAYVDNANTGYTYFLNFGASPSLYVYSARGRQVRTLLRFDLTPLPPGSTVVSARLRLYATGTNKASRGAKAIYAYALQEPWKEGSSTGTGYPDGVSYYASDGYDAWASAGGTYRTPSVATAVQESSGASPPPGSFRTGWLYWDLTALVREWTNGTTPNNGVILVSTVSDQPAFPSDESGNAAYRPQLVVTYK